MLEAKGEVSAMRGKDMCNVTVARSAPEPIFRGIVVGGEFMCLRKTSMLAR